MHQNYVKSFIYAHSSDDDETIKLLIDSGTDCIERKPQGFAII